MKLALEIIKREIDQRELANKYDHLRKEITTKELKELNDVVNLLSLPIVSGSLFEITNQLIELYEERLTRANITRNYIDAHNNQISVNVLEHLIAVINHNDR